jgi:hypothetical protein
MTYQEVCKRPDMCRLCLKEESEACKHSKASIPQLFGLQLKHLLVVLLAKSCISLYVYTMQGIICNSQLELRSHLTWSLLTLYHRSCSCVSTEKSAQYSSSEGSPLSHVPYY